MGSFTDFLSLFKPAPTEVVDVELHLNDNWDKIDTWANSMTGIQQFLTPVASGAGIATYPQGISYFGLGAADITSDPNWAVGYNATVAEVWTFKASSIKATQFWFRSGSFAEGFYRHFGTSSITPWRAFGDQDYMGGTGTATVSIPDATWTKVQMSVTDGNPTTYNITASSGGFIVHADGIYEVGAILSFPGGASTAAVTMGFGKTADAGPSVNNRVSAANIGTSAVVLNGSWTVPMTAGDTVFMFLNHTTGSAKNISDRRLTVKRISGALV